MPTAKSTAEPVTKKASVVKKATKKTTKKPTPQAKPVAKKAARKTTTRTNPAPKTTIETPDLFNLASSWLDKGLSQLDKINPLITTMTRSVVASARNNPKLATSIAAGAVSIGAGLLANKIRGSVDTESIVRRTTEATEALAKQTESLGDTLSKLMKDLSK